MVNYFSMSELVHTDTGEYNIIRGDYVYPNLERLRVVLNVLRGLIGEPIIVNSGYRNDVVNRAVGGVANSLHLQGRAADITCSSFPRLRAICREWHDKGILSECVVNDNFIHIAI